MSDQTFPILTALGGVFLFGAVAAMAPPTLLYQLAGESVLSTAYLVTAVFVIAVVAIALYFGRKRVWLELMVYPGTREEYVLRKDPATFSVEREDTHAGTVVKLWDSAAEAEDWEDLEEPTAVYSEHEAAKLAEAINDEVGDA